MRKTHSYYRHAPRVPYYGLPTRPNYGSYFGWQDRETLDNFFPIESLIAHKLYHNDTYRHHQQGLLNPNRMKEWTGEHSFNTYLNKLQQYDDYQYLWDVYAMAFLNGVTESNTLMSDEALNWVKANLGGKTTSDFGINSSSSGGVTGQHIALLEQTGAYLYAIGAPITAASFEDFYRKFVGLFANFDDPPQIKNLKTFRPSFISNQEIIANVEKSREEVAEQEAQEEETHKDVRDEIRSKRDKRAAGKSVDERFDLTELFDTRRGFSLNKTQKVLLGITGATILGITLIKAVETPAKKKKK